MAPGQDDTQICEAFHILKNLKKIKKHFCTVKQTINKTKSQPTEWEKIFASVMLERVEICVCVCVCYT